MLWTLDNERPTALQIPNSSFADDVAKIHAVAAAAAAAAAESANEACETPTRLLSNVVCMPETPLGTTYALEPTRAITCEAISWLPNTGKRRCLQPATPSPSAGSWRSTWTCRSSQGDPSCGRALLYPEQLQGVAKFCSSCTEPCVKGGFMPHACP